MNGLTCSHPVGRLYASDPERRTEHSRNSDDNTTQSQQTSHKPSHTTHVHSLAAPSHASLRHHLDQLGLQPFQLRNVHLPEDLHRLHASCRKA